MQKSHILLIENRLNDFEHNLIFTFFIHFGKLLPLKLSYLDWLVIKLHPIWKQEFFQSVLNFDYIKASISLDIKTFVVFLQFLTYFQDLDFKLESLGEIP